MKRDAEILSDPPYPIKPRGMKTFSGNRKNYPYKGSLFHKLPPALRPMARAKLNQLLARHKHRLPGRPWLYGLLVASATEVTLHPKTSERQQRIWGQRRYKKRRLIRYYSALARQQGWKSDDIS
ncbi:MAG: hypothetical protein L0Y56_19200 [Nitrospira sp.]|nr:hypothetical protein [Nitrospira sp.]